MARSDVQAQFDHLVSVVLWPEFKKRGYRKSGANFRYYDSAGWGKIVNVQKSAYSDRDNIRFRVNTGLYLREADLVMIGRASEEKFLEPCCLVRKGIGILNNTCLDLWYEVNQQTFLSVLKATVVHDVSSFVLPYLDAIRSVDDILQQIFHERGPDVFNGIRALFIYGYKAEARQWLADELTNTLYTYRTKQLKRLSSELDALQ